MYSEDVGKITDGVVSFAPKELAIEGIKTVTNDAKIYKASGWLKITHTLKPKKD